MFHQVANRFYNSHALVNLALSYRRGDSGNLEDLKIAVGCPTLFREGESGFFTVKLTQSILSAGTQALAVSNPQASSHLSSKVDDSAKISLNC